MSDSDATPPLVVAHRGVHTGGITENTLDAFEAALAAGAEMIELDVRRAASGELVVLHDHRLGPVELARSSLDAFASQTGLRPPLLSDVLDWAQGRIALDVELKEDGYVESLVPLFSGFRDGGGELIVTSFLEQTLVQLSELAPEIERGLLLMFTAQLAAARTTAAQASIILPEMRIFTPALVEEATAAGLEVIVWDYMAAKHGPELMRDTRVRAGITHDVPGALSARG
jgi:glycerophosphoryl diester phosphodiesterase